MSTYLLPNCELRYTGTVRSHVGAGGYAVCHAGGNRRAKTTAFVNAELTAGTWGAVVITVYQGPTQSGPWYATSTTLATGTRSASCDVDADYIRLAVSTGEASSVIADIGISIRDRV